MTAKRTRKVTRKDTQAGLDKLRAESTPTPEALEDQATSGGGGEDPATASRFGVFDPTRLRFLGGVYATRRDAEKAAAAMGVPTAEIRPL